MYKTVWLLAGLAALTLVVGMWGCSSTNDAAGTGVDTAAKPVKPPPGDELPLVGDAGGSIYYSVTGSADTMKMGWDGSSPTAVCDDPYCANGFEVSHGTNRFLLYHKPVASWPSKYGDMQPIYNVYMVPESGGTPVNIIGDDHFQTFTPGISVDDTMIVINGAGIWDEATQDFIPESIGSYVADLVYGVDGYPSGIENLRMVCPYLLGDLSPDKQRGAVTEAAVSGGPADLWIASVLTGARTNLTNTSTLDESGAAWSPVLAADRIAYTRPVVDRKGKTTAQDVYTMPADGSTAICAVTKANSGVGWNRGAQWSPDGSQVAFVASSTQTGMAAIMRSAADGSTTAKDLTGFTISRVSCIKWRQ